MCALRTDSECNTPLCHSRGQFCIYRASCSGSHNTNHFAMTYLYCHLYSKLCTGLYASYTNLWQQWIKFNLSTPHNKLWKSSLFLHPPPFHSFPLCFIYQTIRLCASTCADYINSKVLLRALIPSAQNSATSKLWTSSSSVTRFVYELYVPNENSH